MKNIEWLMENKFGFKTIVNDIALHMGFVPTDEWSYRWLMAEHDDGSAPESCRQHADQAKQAADADCESCDSREKLEADANGYVASWWQSDWVDSFAHANSMKRDIMRLLDRQEAITERECVRKCVKKWQHIAEDRDRAEMERDDLKTERDELRAKVKYLESWAASYDDVDCFIPLDSMPEFLLDPPGYIKANMAKMQEKVGELEAERDELREKLSIALGHAHETLALVDMDGNVVS